MATVASKDGTKIAYDRSGSGPVVILVAGALSSRLSWSGAELAKRLSDCFTVINYDRRGRGDSTDTLPYSPEREIEDIEALIDEMGGRAFLYGHSSGAALALEATAVLGGKVKKLAIYEVPYNSNTDARKAMVAYNNQLTKLLAADDRSGAVSLFMERLGVPKQQIEGMIHSPNWQALEALAQTLTYESEVLGGDASIPGDLMAGVAAPTLVMYGGTGVEFMRNTAQTLADAIPNAQLRELKDQAHNANAEVLAPVLMEFFSSPTA